MTASALSPLEIACGHPLGCVDGTASLPDLHDPVSPRRALEDAMLPALTRPPCVVSFSGGRDSSAVLAVAVHLARREGLPLPIPVATQFPGLPEADESGWQQRVVQHLGLNDWERVQVHDELDLLGGLAQAALARHGFLWPPGCTMTALIASRAPGGSMLTGIDGDGVFGTWKWVWLGELVARRARPSASDVLNGLRAMRPAWTRVGRSAPQPAGLPWLRPGPQRAHAEAVRREFERDSWRWDRHLAWEASRRFREIAGVSWRTLARESDTLLLHPLLDRRFLSALAHAGGRFGIGDRTAIMRTLFGDLLPPDVIARATKALGDRIYWSNHSREFIARWDGGGIDPNLVDEQALRREWAKPIPHAATGSLLQSAWLASVRQSAAQTTAGGI